jgi:hypothetical protein
VVRRVRYYLDLQCQKVSQARTQQKLAICFAGFMADLLFDPDDGGSMFLKNVGLPPDYMILEPRRCTPHYAYMFVANLRCCQNNS